MEESSSNIDHHWKRPKKDSKYFPSEDVDDIAIHPIQMEIFAKELDKNLANSGDDESQEILDSSTEMGKDESPQINRRTTRSSSCTTPNSKAPLEATKATKHLQPLSINDLVFHGESTSLDELISSFPGRKVQIHDLIKLLGPLNSPWFHYSSMEALQQERQLLLHRKNESNGYLSAKRCEKPSDFVNLLREALSTLIDSLKGNQGKSSSKKFSPQSDTGFVEPFPVHFPGYTEDDLRRIFMKNQANPKLYSSFLDLVLRPFYRISRRVDELSAAFSPLFKKYCEPLADLGTLLNEDTKRKLFSHLQPFISLSLNETFSAPSRPLLKASANKELNMKKSITKKLGVCETLDEIDFHMSTSAKYLLISAFLASRNPATLDASLFDSTGGSDNRKRKRKSSEKSMEQKETKEQELLMKGPEHSHYSLDDEELQSGDLGAEGSNGGLMSDILLQLSSLCNANFITKGGSCPLEGSTRYRSTVSEDLALKENHGRKWLTFVPAALKRVKVVVVKLR
ncbi:hypothetical protein DH2020_025630 [Rehmannia glutinosa]|uniref:Uncharacterized protein n=1 Tax=Rehmannia glutinosa TaxID=99300 RepID=A0ABR0VZD6_REHGL